MSLDGKRTQKNVSGRLRAPLAGWRKFMPPARRLLLSAGVLVVAALFLSPAPALAQWRLIGCDFDGILYDVDTATGAATNPRPTGIPGLAGIAYSAPQDILYGLSTAGSDRVLGTSLFTIDPITGSSVRIGHVTGPGPIVEGDIAFDPVSGKLYGLTGIGLGTYQMFTINDQSAAGTVIGNMPGVPSDLSAMAFDAQGSLYVLDTRSNQILTVDPSNANILSSSPIAVDYGPDAGMAYDSVTGLFYIGDGWTGAQKRLYSMQLASWQLTEIGPLGNDNGLSGLTFIPEPATALVMLLGLCCRICRVDAIGHDFDSRPRGVSNARKGLRLT